MKKKEGTKVKLEERRRRIVLSESENKIINNMVTTTSASFSMSTLDTHQPLTGSKTYGVISDSTVVAKSKKKIILGSLCFVGLGVGAIYGSNLSNITGDVASTKLHNINTHRAAEHSSFLQKAFMSPSPIRLRDQIPYIHLADSIKSGPPVEERNWRSARRAEKNSRELRLATAKDVWFRRLDASDNQKAVNAIRAVELDPVNGLLDSRVITDDNSLIASDEIAQAMEDNYFETLLLMENDPELQTFVTAYQTDSNNINLQGALLKTAIDNTRISPNLLTKIPGGVDTVVKYLAYGNDPATFAGRTELDLATSADVCDQLAAAGLQQVTTDADAAYKFLTLNHALVSGGIGGAFRKSKRPVSIEPKFRGGEHGKRLYRAASYEHDGLLFRNGENPIDSFGTTASTSTCLSVALEFSKRSKEKTIFVIDIPPHKEISSLAPGSSYSAFLKESEQILPTDTLLKWRGEEWVTLAGEQRSVIFYNVE